MAAIQQLLAAMKGKILTALYSPLTSYGMDTLYDATGAWEFWGGITLTILRDGTWSVYNDLYATTDSGDWAVTKSSTVGDDFWVRFTRTSYSASGGGATASTGWLQLNANRAVNVYTNNNGSGSGFGYATYTIEIATDSGGSNIVSTTTGVQLMADSSYDG